LEENSWKRGQGPTAGFAFGRFRVLLA